MFSQKLQNLHRVVRSDVIVLNDTASGNQQQQNAKTDLTTPRRSDYTVNLSPCRVMQVVSCRTRKTTQHANATGGDV